MIRRLSLILVTIGTMTRLFAVGSVNQSLAQIPGSTNFVFTENWTADAANGSVPATVISGTISIQGFRIVSVEIAPGSPAPTNNYTVTMTDFSGADILGGSGANQSSTTASVLPSLSTAPPIYGSLTVNVTGNVVNSAKGSIFVYFAPVSQVIGNTPTGASLTGNNLLTGANTFQGTSTFSGPLNSSAASTFSGTTTMANTNKIIYWDGNVYPYTSVGLQNAINAACNGVTPGRVIMSAFGTFSISGVTIPSLCTLEGMGQGQTILQLPSSSAAAASVLSNASPSLGNTGIYLHDFTVDGNKAGQTNTGQFGILLTKVANSTIFHIECKNSMGNAASCVQWLTTAGGANTEDHDNTVEFCYFHDNGSSSVNNADGLAIGGVRIRVVGVISSNNTDSGVGLQGGTDFAILNGIYQGNTQTGVAFGGSSATQGTNTRVTIENNVFLSNGDSIVSDRTNDLVITGNMMKTTTSSSGNKEHILLVSTQGASIVGNRLVGALSNGITINDLLATDLTTHMTITGNTIEANNAAGIRVNITNSGALIKNLTISGNTITNNSQNPTNSIDAINVSIAAGPLTAISGLVITDNILSDDQGAPTQRYGIAMTAGLTASALIGGNQSTGNATGTFVNLPTDTNSVFYMGVPPVPFADNTLTEGTQASAWKQVFSYAKVWKETTTPASVASDDICYGDSTAHGLKCSYNNGTFLNIPQAAQNGLVFDGVYGTYRVTTDQTITAGASLTNIPGLSWTFPANTALNVKFTCDLLYSQATAAASDSFGFQDVTVAPTNAEAYGRADTSTTAFTAGNTDAAGVTTAVTTVTFTPSAATTVFGAHIDGMIEQPSNASTSAFNIMAQFTTNNGTIKRGSSCQVF